MRFEGGDRLGTRGVSTRTLTTGRLPSHLVVIPPSGPGAASGRLVLNVVAVVDTAQGWLRLSKNIVTIADTVVSMAPGPRLIWEEHRPYLPPSLVHLNRLHIGCARSDLELPFKALGDEVGFMKWNTERSAASLRGHTSSSRSETWAANFKRASLGDTTTNPLRTAAARQPTSTE
ncbi:unnamed protein product [Boreogadus saida]